jgi:beta-glucosidase/6-phospho-beta-glucosidase/beta-galactosidase
MPPSSDSPFRTFFLGGFECSTHRLRDGRRLDVLASTAHDVHAAADYAQLAELGIRTVREGFRWHRVERRAGQYDFASVRPLVRAAAATGTQVVWDLLHFGWPDDVDPFGAGFVRRFARYARACATMLAAESDAVPWYVPVNEISFLAWGGGDAGWINPYCTGRGFEFKVQLCRAAIEAIEAIREVQPHARFATAEPVINVAAADPADPAQSAEAEGHRQAQFQAWDMLAGRLWPQLGGDPKYLDLLGVNFYYNNQRVHGGGLLTDRRDPRYRPFRSMLAEVHARYGRPLFVAETGIEGEAHVTGVPRYEMPLPATADARPEWLGYVGAEVRAARAAGVPVEGICLYPVLNHLGWDDDRHCQNGLLDFPHDAAGRRGVVAPLADELARQQALLEEGGRAQPRARRAAVAGPAAAAQPVS